MGHKLLVSFEIAWDDDETYNKLWKALDSAIQSGLSNSQWWAETTAFYIVDAKENSADFAARVATEAGLRRSKDRLLVVNMNGNGGTAWGKIEDDTIFTLLPMVKKRGLVPVKRKAPPT